MKHNNKSTFHKLLSISLLVFLIACSLRMWNLGEAGQAWDEKSLLRDYAYYHVRDAMNLDFDTEFWWKGTPDHPPLVRYMRGVVSLPDITGWDKEGLPIYDYDLKHNRLLSVILTSLAAVMVFIIGARYITLYSGIAAAIIFSMLPIPLGHSQIAMLEPLTLFFFTASMLTYFLFLENPTTKKLILAGIALGFALLARETHLMLLPMMLIMILLKYKTGHEKNPKSILYKTLGIFGISFVTFFCLWPMPFFHLDYMYHYFVDLRVNVTTSIPEVFFGKLLLVPIPYYFVHVIITTPLLIIILCLIGLKKIDRSNNWIWYSLILWLLFPFLLSFYPNRQQGIRYIIQICIPLALIAAMGFETVVSKFVKNMHYKFLLLLILFLYLFIILWRITPYYTDYYNILVGGPKGVYEKGLFHLGWWGHGIKEAFDYLDANTLKGATVGVATSPTHITPELPGRKISFYKNDQTYDYVVVNYYNVVREGFDDSKIKSNYKVVYSVKADGAHLVEVYKRK